MATSEYHALWDIFPSKTWADKYERILCCTYQEWVEYLFESEMPIEAREADEKLISGQVNKHEYELIQVKHWLEMKKWMADRMWDNRRKDLDNE